MCITARKNKRKTVKFPGCCAERTNKSSVVLSNSLCLCASVSVCVDRVAAVQPDSLHGRDAAGVTVRRSHLWPVSQSRKNAGNKPPSLLCLLRHLPCFCFIFFVAAGTASAQCCLCACACRPCVAPPLPPYPIHCSSWPCAAWRASAAAASTSAPSA